MRKPDLHSALAWTELLRKYRDGTLSPDERTQLMELSKQNPFVAEAVEGLSVVADGDTFATDVAALQAQLQQRTQRSHSFVYRSLRAAAVLVFLLVASYLIYIQVNSFVPSSTSQDQPSATQVPAEEKASTTLAKPPVAFLPSFGIERTSSVEKPSLPSTLALAKPPSPSDAALSARGVSIQSKANSDVPPLAESEPIAESIPINQPPSIPPAKARSVTYVTEYKVGSSTVVGQVFGEEESEPLPGVNVLVKGTDTGTVTDIDGRFTLPVGEENATLVFSAIGYTTHEQTVSSAEPIQITLEPDIQTLSEVVVIGYGTQERRERPLSTSARPVGGMPSFKKYLRDNLRYPADWSDDRQEVIKVNFQVQADGSLTGFTIKKGVNQWLNQEAIRVIREGPRWTPAIQNDQALSQQVTVRVRFKKKN